MFGLRIAVSCQEQHVGGNSRSFRHRCWDMPCLDRRHRHTCQTICIAWKSRYWSSVIWAWLDPSRLHLRGLYLRKPFCRKHVVYGIFPLVKDICCCCYVAVWMLFQSHFKFRFKFTPVLWIWRLCWNEKQSAGHNFCAIEEVCFSLSSILLYKTKINK